MKIFLRLIFVATVVAVAFHFVDSKRTEFVETEGLPTGKFSRPTRPQFAASKVIVPANTVVNLSPLETLQAALLGTNQFEMNAAFQHLAAYLARHPEKKAEALATLKSDGNYPQLFYLLSQWNGEEPTVAGGALLKGWAAELIQTDRSREGQQAALGLLSHATPDSEFVPMISQLYRDAANNQLQVSAIVTLKDWADRNPALQSAVQEQLVGILNSSSDDEVRARAFEAVASVGLPDATLIDAVDYLWKEPTDANRSLFAQAFEKAGDVARASAITRLEQSCTHASDPAIARSALAQIARIGKRTSMDVLSRIGASHPELQGDVNDYLRILQEGASDIGTIDRKKLESDLQTAALSQPTIP